VAVLLGSAREADAASFDQQVKVWRRDVDAALLDAVTIFGEVPITIVSVYVRPLLVVAWLA
jgi:hypothetical protein